MIWLASSSLARFKLALGAAGTNDTTRVLSDWLERVDEWEMNGASATADLIMYGTWGSFAVCSTPERSAAGWKPALRNAPDSM